MVPNKWLGTGCQTLCQPYGTRESRQRNYDAYLHSSHAVQEDSLDQSDQSWKDKEIEQAERLKPTLGKDIFKWRIFAVVVLSNGSVETFITTTPSLRRPVSMAVGNHDCPVYQDIGESENVGDRVEQTKVEAAARVRGLLWR